jgi:hypothetical protein
MTERDLRVTHRCVGNHHIQALPTHPDSDHDLSVGATPGLYSIRIGGELGATALSAFPALVHHVEGRETVLTGLLEDRAAVFGVLGQIEALGLELLEVRQIRPRAGRRSPQTGRVSGH